MSVISKGHYDLIVDDYRDQGAKITMKKKKSFVHIVPVLVFIISGFAAFEIEDHNTFSGQELYFGIALAVAVLLFIFYHVISIHSESLLILASIGITVQQSSLLGTSSRCYGLQEIQDVVIIEAVTMSKIIFQLVLLPKQKDHTCLIPESAPSDSSSKQRLYPLFKCFRPKLKDLQMIYRHIQEKLILPSQVNR
ncbi:uncharacterized protein LOC123545794 [Mercenaria mercenaria]|uniref:uncharacterized protein LOC123545794 n=1 Tax=Mercenaria mercenaria TaxID=6596 RepID=UPI00234E3998|nr:uncharacterized protein LOC123545794 [Mercenaria mercenaria]